MGILFQSLMSGDAPKNWFEAADWGLKADTYRHGYDSVLEYLYNDIILSSIEDGKRIRGK